MKDSQILTELGWDAHQIEGLRVRCMREGKHLHVEARKLQRQAMREGSFPDPVTRFLRVLFWLPARRLLLRWTR